MLPTHIDITLWTVDRQSPDRESLVKCHMDFCIESEQLPSMYFVCDFIFAVVSFFCDQACWNGLMAQWIMVRGN